jgi:hypothetical protein
MDSSPGYPKNESNVNARIIAIMELTEAVTNVVFDNIDFAEIKLADLGSLLKAKKIVGNVYINDEEFQINIMPNYIIAGARRVVYQVKYILGEKHKLDFEWMPGTSEINVVFNPTGSCTLKLTEIINFTNKIIDSYSSQENSNGS